MAELVDAADSKSVFFTEVWVQVPLPAPKFKREAFEFCPAKPWRSRAPSAIPTLSSRPMHYVYLIQSLSFSTRKYIGLTTDLKRRLTEHNSKHSSHTAQYAPWKLITYVAFETLEKAQAFEAYLKQGSGHAFAAKHLW